MKKQLAAILLVSLLLLAPPAARAEQAKLPETDDLRAAVLMEAQTGTRLWAKEADTVCACLLYTSEAETVGR